MGGAHEAMEHAEHIGHAAHGHGGDGEGHKGPGKGVGITMALLGVMLALCAAMVGAERTEFISTVVEQSNVLNEGQAVSTKYRLALSELEQTYAVTPSRKHTEQYAKDVDALPMKPEYAELTNAIKFSTKELVQLLTPRKTEVKSFIDTIERYAEERKEVREWGDAFAPEARAHFEAAEWYEKAQLASEIGIVIASVALLMASRPFWFISLVFGTGCAFLLVFTWFRTHQALEKTCDEGDEEHGRPPAVEIDWEVPDEHAEKKPEGNVCIPGAKQRLHHEEHTYKAFRSRWVEVGAERKHVSLVKLADDAVLCRVVRRFDIENSVSCQDINDAMDKLETGQLEVHGAHGGHEMHLAHDAHSGGQAPAPSPSSSAHEAPAPHH